MTRIIKSVDHDRIMSAIINTKCLLDIFQLCAVRLEHNEMADPKDILMRITTRGVLYGGGMGRYESKEEDRNED